MRPTSPVCSIAGKQLPRLVDGDGSGDHRQSRSARAGCRAHRSFCRTDPDIQKHFARATFLSDNRDDLARVDVPTLVLQCADDIIAPVEVGRFVHPRIAASVFVQLEATGHCPNLSAPEETVRAIEVVSRPGVNGAQEILGGPDEAFYAALLDDDPEALYDNAPCGYLSTLPDGTIVKANGTFFAWTGFDRDRFSVASASKSCCPPVTGSSTRRTTPRCCKCSRVSARLPSS